MDEEMKRDAERWRYVRDNPGVLFTSPFNTDLLRGDAADSAVDRAVKWMSETFGE